MDKSEESSMSSSESLASTVLSQAIGARSPDPALLSELVNRATSSCERTAAEASRDFFVHLVEPLCDAFDAEAAAQYVHLFARAVEQIYPAYTANSLTERYQRIRRPQRYQGTPQRVCVLSRVTLGADVAVSSVVIDGAKRRFPEAEICFVGPSKNAELFARDKRVKPLVSPYTRSGLMRDRLEASVQLRAILDHPDTLVIDPDSRLSQLGIIPVCDEDSHLFFESRTYREASADSLPLLTSKWIHEVLGISDARPFLAPDQQPYAAEITVSLGVGGNQQKRVHGDFETSVVAALLATGKRLMVDRGAGGEETERVDRIAGDLGNPSNLVLHDGSFASFASHILQSQLYFGYDSAGQHVAAAGSIPLITLFAGYATEKTYDRWRPSGTGPIWTIKVTEENRESAGSLALSAISEAVEAVRSRPAQGAVVPVERASP
jgi:ADP-heptose:LPS heptosyltransferase